MNLNVNFTRHLTWDLGPSLIKESQMSPFLMGHQSLTLSMEACETACETETGEALPIGRLSVCVRFEMRFDRASHDKY